MSDSFYIRLGLTVRGPYSVSDLHELANRGSFSKSHDVSADKKSWTSASGRPELFPSARRPPVLQQGQRSADSDENSSSTDPAHVNSRTQGTAKQSPGKPGEASASRPADDESTRLTAGQSMLERAISRQAIGTVVAGPAGFVLLMVCTAMVVMRLRSSPFAAGENIGLIVLLLCDLICGSIAVTLGHLAIKKFPHDPGAINERNLIVIGLSCGYTVLILCILYALVLLISALS